LPWTFKTPNIECEVSYKKAPNKLLAPKPKLLMRTEEGLLVTKKRVVEARSFILNGKEIQAKIVNAETGEDLPEAQLIELLEHYQYRLLDENLCLIEQDTKKGIYERVLEDGSRQLIGVFNIQVLEDGKEQPVARFKRSNVLDLDETKWVPSLCIEPFLIQSVYEIYSENLAVQRQLYEEAEKRLKADQIGITSWSWGGFDQCYAFVLPLVREGKFVWLVKFTNEEPEYQHLTDIPSKVKIPIKEAPTLERLPPVQLLVAVDRRRRT